MSEERAKKPEDMSIYELLDELVDVSKNQRLAKYLIILSGESAAHYDGYMEEKARRIDACRDEIVRRVGN